MSKRTEVLERIRVVRESARNKNGITDIRASINELRRNKTTYLQPREPLQTPTYHTFNPLGKVMTSFSCASGGFLAGGLSGYLIGETITARNVAELLDPTKPIHDLTRSIMVVCELSGAFLGLMGYSTHSYNHDYLNRSRR